MNETRQRRALLRALLFSTLVSVGLCAVGVLSTHSIRYWFLLWNLGLAWLPLVFIIMLSNNLKTRRWLSWQNVSLSLLWLAFLPNSFYLVSDLVHIHSSAPSNVLYDTALFMSFAFNGLVLGFASLYVMHRALLRRLKPQLAHLLVTMILFVSSFAIYLGRDLRWNTWDVLVNPAGILLDVSDRVINPSAHSQTFVVTATFFALLGSMYVVVWQFSNALRPQK